PKRPTPTSTDAMRLLDLTLGQSAEPPADGLDLGVVELATLVDEAAFAGLHLGDPLAGERAVLDASEDLAHVLAHVLVDDLRTARMASVLRGVRDRRVHPLEAAVVDQVDDQLELVEALVVGDLRLVPRLDERLEAELDQ